MKQKIEDIASALRVMPGQRSGGKELAKDEFENFLKNNSLTQTKIGYLLEKSSPSAKERAVDKYPQLMSSSTQQADFTEHGFRDGLGKLMGALHGALDYSTPSGWKSEIQQLHTLTSDLIRNSRLIFDGLSPDDFPFYSNAIETIENNVLPALKTAMTKNVIPIEEQYPLKGSEFFYKLDSNEWKSLGINKGMPKKLPKPNP